jgi:hypothetical protein
MKNRKTLAKLACALLVLVLVFATSVALNPQQAKAQDPPVCSNASLYGRFAVQGGGSVNNADQPYAINVLNDYDGQGNANATILVLSVAGKVQTNLHSQGKYQVNSDCSYTQTSTRADGTSVDYAGVVFDDGNKIAITQIDAGTVTNQTGERLNRYYPFLPPSNP